VKGDHGGPAQQEQCGEAEGKTKQAVKRGGHGEDLLWPFFSAPFSTSME
jgi:hypothetical protein